MSVWKLFFKDAGV